MIASLERTFQHIESRKRTILDKVRALPIAEQSFQPKPGCWSALEVLDHLQKTEESILQAVLSNLPDGHPLVFGDRVKGALLTALFLTPSRVKVPRSVTQILPDAVPALSTIEERWQETRYKIGRMLEVFPAEQLDRAVFKHPVSGWMSMGRTMAFWSAHIRHHGFQLRRIERALNERSLPR